VITFLYALLIAIGITALMIGIPELLGALAQRRRFSEFASLECPRCGAEFGRDAVSNGKDTSPWEEVWSDGKGHIVECDPEYRMVTCPQCSTESEIRFQTQGEFFGPRLSVRDRDEHREQFMQIITLHDD
jgi:predicted RNA-binding Zn-ribbon protein involved in translation (DUF1610 family)